MNPLDLNKLHLDEALIYGLEIDTRSQTVVLVIEVNAERHKQVYESLGLTLDAGVLLLELVFGGVSSVAVDGMLPKRSGVAPDEPPHDYEVSAWKVDRILFRKGQHRLNVRTYWGPRCSIVFKTVAVRESSRSPGVVHDYEAEAAGKRTGG